MPTRLPLLAAAVLAAAAPLPAHPVVRGPRTLTDAFRAALGPALADRTRAVPVAIVVDATPYTRAHAEWIGEAMHATRPGRADHWRLGRLGDPLHPGRARQASELTIRLQEVLDGTHRHASTLAALRNTLRGFRDRGAVILYLADWHFEDDEGLERLLAGLARRGQTLTVVGSEAAFTRGWLDGFTLLGLPEQEADIGRNPWRPDRPGAPWHGGETAWPHLPWRFGGAGWDTTFPAGLSRLLPGRPADGAGLPERLRERIARLDDGERTRRPLRYPLPSAFGPWALMRAAERTGGRYVLWSWNASGRAAVRYDYTRCELFAPDLRPRARILSEIGSRPLARALVKAWEIAAHARVDLVETTPPVARGLASGRTIEPTARDSRLSFAWPTRDAWRQFVRRCERTVAAADDALRVLDHALATPRDRDDAVDRRYRADAELFRHVLAVQRFSLGEALALAGDVDRDAWDGDAHPALRRVVYLPRTRPGEGARAIDLPLADPGRGAALLDERRALLRRYRGTPFGEQIRRNDVATWRLARAPDRDASSDGGLGGTPAFSDGDRAPPTRREPAPSPPPGGGSGGSGPTSGG